MKAKLNPMFENVSGGLGELVFRVIRGKVVISRKPEMNGSELSEEQVEHRERFKQAVAYGKSVMADGEVRPLYETAAKARNMPIFALTVADFFNAPTIHNVDISAYNGQAGSKISILATDDFSLVNVHVSLSNDQGNVFESGAAVETSEGSGLWVYTALVSAPNEAAINIKVVATDRPGGTTVANVNKYFPTE